MNDIVQPSCHVTYMISKVSAGFPSPADDYLENNLNLDKLLIKNRPSTFLIRAGGDSMINIGIYDGDCLLYTSPSPRDVEEARMPSSA